MADENQDDPGLPSAFAKDTQLGSLLETFNSMVPIDGPPKPPKPWLQIFRAMCFSGVGYQWAHQQCQLLYLGAALAQDYPEWWALFVEQLPPESKTTEYYRQIKTALGIVREMWQTVETFEHIHDNDAPAEGT